MNKKHRVVGALLRAVSEDLDLAALFESKTARSNELLETWYDDEIVANREYRAHVENTGGAEAKRHTTERYRHLSHLTHRSYRILLASYSLGTNDRLVHDRTASRHSEANWADTMLVLPETIAAYMVGLADLTIRFTSELYERGQVSKQEVEVALLESLETDTVPRRFFPLG